MTSRQPGFVEEVDRRRLVPLMNHTKWEELRLAMMGLDHPPHWCARTLGPGHVSPWDGEWGHHFALDGDYRSQEWVELRMEHEEQAREVLNALRQVRVPGSRTNQGFSVLGHAPAGEPVEYP